MQKLSVAKQGGLGVKCCEMLGADIDRVLTLIASRLGAFACPTLSISATLKRDQNTKMVKSTATAKQQGHHSHTKVS